MEEIILFYGELQDRKECCEELNVIPGENVEKSYLFVHIV